jgi:hypothetical protein
MITIGDTRIRTILRMIICSGGKSTQKNPTVMRIAALTIGDIVISCYVFVCELLNIREVTVYLQCEVCKEISLCRCFLL